MNTIQDTLATLTLGDPTTFLNLTLFPLLGRTGYERDYLTLATAVRAGTASIREISEGGSVPELLLKNTGKEPVLVLDGEELIGAKQNRTANVTILVPSGKTVRVPVTFVESGRWGYHSREFKTSEQVHFKRGRANKMTSVTTSLKQAGTRIADQGSVWTDISSKAMRMRVSAPTNAMADVFETHRTRLQDYVGAFNPQPEQTGAVFAIGDRIEGLEIFDCSQTLTEMLPKLIRSYAIDAIEAVRSQREIPTVDSAQGFIERLVAAKVETYKAVGVGTEVRVSAPGVIAAGLVAEGRLVHLAAFSAPTDADRPSPDSRGFARSRSRRSGMGR
jgi:hypothetical protein